MLVSKVTGSCRGTLFEGDLNPGPAQEVQIGQVAGEEEDTVGRQRLAHAVPLDDHVARADLDYPGLEPGRYGAFLDAVLDIRLHPVLDRAGPARRGGARG